MAFVYWHGVSCLGPDSCGVRSCCPITDIDYSSARSIIGLMVPHLRVLLQSFPRKSFVSLSTKDDIIFASPNRDNGSIVIQNIIFFLF